MLGCSCLDILSQQMLTKFIEGVYLHGPGVHHLIVSVTIEGRSQRSDAEYLQSSIICNVKVSFRRYCEGRQGFKDNLICHQRSPGAGAAGAVANLTEAELLVVLGPEDVLHPAVPLDVVQDVVITHRLLADVKVSVLGEADVDDGPEPDGGGLGEVGLVSGRAAHGAPRHHLQLEVRGQTENLGQCEVRTREGSFYGP